MASGSKKVIYAALVGNSLVATTKFIAAAITGSSAMLSEGIHSVVDTGNQVLLLWGNRQSRKPADEQFPFGHGREIYFWCFIVAILIFALGAGFSIYEGIHHLLHPQPMKNPMVNYVVLGLAIVFEGGALWVALKVFNRAKGSRGIVEAVQHGKDPTLFVVLFEDTAAMAGLLIALGGIALGQITGNPAFDGIAAILIGVILGGTAIWLAYETKSLLIGESADPEIVQTIREYCLELSPVKVVNEVLTMHMGPEFILVNVSVDMADKATAGEIEKAIAVFDQRIKSTFPAIKRVFVEAEARSRRS
ncbi:MAG: cation diffusion facilitator family transporter [Desulfobacterales bacterium]|jgi:cation diffusion facilitator family transporter